MRMILLALTSLTVGRTDASLNRVAKVAVETTALGRVVDIACESDPVFTVFRLGDPVRIVIDIARGDVSKLDGPIEIGDGVIGDIATAQFADDRNALGRLIIGLDKAFDYEVKQQGKHIRIVVRAQGPTPLVLARAKNAPAGKSEVDRAAAAKAEAERLAAAKVEAERIAAAKAEADRIAVAKAEADRIAAAKAEAEHVAAAKLEAQRQEAARLAAAKAEQERIAAAKAEEEKGEAARIAAANAEKVRTETARAAAAKAEADRVAAAKLAAERAEKARLAAAKLEMERAAAKKAEAERVAAVKLETERAAAKAEAERLAKLEAAKKADAQRVLATTDKTPRATTVVALNGGGTELAQARASVQARELSVHEQKSQVVVDKSLEKVAVHKRKNGSDIFLKIKGGKPAYEVLELEDPPRVVFDLIGVATKLPKHSSWSLGDVGKMRLGLHEDKVRLVLDGAIGLPKYELAFDDKGVTITTELVPAKAQPAPMLVAETPAPAKLAPAPAAVAVEVEPKQAAPAPVAQRVAAERGKAAATVKTIDFQKKGVVTRLSFALPETAQFELDRSIERAPQLIVQNVTLTKELETARDVSSLGTPVSRLTSFNERQGKGLRIVANLNSNASHRVFKDAGTLVWEFTAPAAPPPLLADKGAEKPEQVPEPVKPVAVSMKPVPEVAGFSAEAAQMMRTTTTASTARVSIDVRGADLLNVLRLISDVSGENIVAGDDVQGKITLRLRNVPWEQALDAALKTKGYGRVRSGTIIRVAPLDKLQKEKEAEILRMKADEQIQPTFVRLIPINYATAKDILEQIKPLLTKDRGKATVDERTNTIVAEDLLDVLNKIEGLARRLDTQTPQVLIESRIVEANTQHVRDIGIQWGGSGLFSPATGNATGLAFPNLIGFNGGADDATTNTNGTANPGRFAVNLPAPVSQGSGGAIGLVFGNASNTGLLSLRLSALENNGSVRIVSAPKVTTLDNVRARISQGVSIPISVTSAAGVNTRFIDAFLELEVKPHVTQDGSIMMEIKATKNEPNFSRTGAQGDPTIDKKVAETQVLVKDGDTTVIGGIYTRNTTTTYNEVPFISKIPVLGWLFKRKRSQDDRAELLVFITPRIVNRQQSSIVAGGGL